ncbi:MAG: IS256 family transposase [Acidobacteriota bacterium]|nr:IS256 family transposase [Acidobacteriota bacterium]
MAIKKEILDELLKDRDPKTMFSSQGLLGDLKKALAERVLNAEMDHHLAGSTQDEVSEGEKPGNHRNGYSKKTVLTDNESLDLSIPRDRRGTFEPQLIAKYQRRFPGFDDKIISMYARGMSTREIQGHLRELYGIEASPQLISTVTDAVLEEVGRWQSRPLDPLYALVFFDALRVKMRDEGTVRNKAVYLAIGVTPDGRKDVLGIWIEQTEGAKFWLRVMTEIKNRGVNDILIAIIDGLKGFPEAINSVFPETQIQTCIVHLIRNSLDFCSWKDRKPIAKELKTVYRAADAQAAHAALQSFEDGPWGARFAAITALWRRHWVHVIPFFAYPAEVRKMIYTTDAIESLNAKLRRSVRSRGHFPSDEAALKLIWLQLREITQKWTMPAREWAAAKAQFAVVFGDRFEVNR